MALRTLPGKEFVNADTDLTEDESKNKLDHFLSGRSQKVARQLPFLESKSADGESLKKMNMTHGKKCL